jgi:hypothetical protein
VGVRGDEAAKFDLVRGDAMPEIGMRGEARFGVCARGVVGIEEEEVLAFLGEIFDLEFGDGEGLGELETFFAFSLLFAFGSFLNLSICNFSGEDFFEDSAAGSGFLWGMGIPTLRGVAACCLRPGKYFCTSDVANISVIEGRSLGSVRSIDLTRFARSLLYIEGMGG